MVDEIRDSDICPRCGGRGWIVRQDGGAGTAARCECWAQGLPDRLLSAARLPESHRDKRLSSFQAANEERGVREQLQAALFKSKDYVERYLGADGKPASHGLLFSGPTGCGKTHLAVGVLVELIERYRVRGLFVNLTSLFLELQQTFDASAPFSKFELLDPLRRAEVLVIDELGAQRPSDWVQSVLYYLLNSRYSDRKATILTTNCALGTGTTMTSRGEMTSAPGGRVGLADRVDATLISRLHEMAASIPLDSVPDFRREVRSLSWRH